MTEEVTWVRILVYKGSKDWLKVQLGQSFVKGKRILPPGNSIEEIFAGEFVSPIEAIKELKGNKNENHTSTSD